MTTHRFRAGTMQAAIQAAKQALGPDALIVEVRRVPGTGPSSRYDDVEIIAASEDQYEQLQVVPDIEQIARRSRAANGYRDVLGSAAAGAYTPVPGAARPAHHGTDTLLAQLGLLPPLSDKLARTLREVSSLGEARIALGDVLRLGGVVGAAPVVQGERQVVALVGPSGVGKTTTIAKLAAIIHHIQQRRVALITADPRAGAIAQLRAFAEVLQVPFYAVASRDELQYALDSADTVETIFIDTAGINPYSAQHVKDLRDLLILQDAHSVYLATAMTADFSDQVEAARRFSLLRPDGLIVTKVDETLRAPLLVGLAQQLQLPLTYVCAGPNVPDDITLATPELLSDLLLQALAHAA